MTSIVATRPTNNAVMSYSMDDLLRMGEIVLASRLAPEGIDTKEKAAAIMLQGRELGLAPMESLQVLYSPKQGQVGRMTKLIVAQFRACGHDYVVRESTPSTCTVTFYLSSGRQIEHTLTRAECDEAGWSMQSRDGKREGKYAWRAMPAIMLRYRTLTTGINQCAPEIYRKVLVQTAGDESDDLPDADVWGDSGRIMDRISELEARIEGLRARQAELQVAQPPDGRRPTVIEGTVVDVTAKAAKKAGLPWQGAFWAWVHDHMEDQGLTDENVRPLYAWAKETGAMHGHLSEYPSLGEAQQDYARAVQAWLARDAEPETEEIPL